MLTKLIVVTALAASCGIAFADATHGTVFVVPDSVLAQNGRTREQANRECPPCEKRWREAWAAAGTKQDTHAFAVIRRDTTRPDGMAPAPSRKER